MNALKVLSKKKKKENKIKSINNQNLTLFTYNLQVYFVPTLNQVNTCKLFKSGKKTINNENERRPRERISLNG